MTDAVLKDLADLDQLQTLSLTPSTVASDRIKQIQKALPKCRVTQEDPPDEFPQLEGMPERPTP